MKLKIETIVRIRHHGRLSRKSNALVSHGYLEDGRSCHLVRLSVAWIYPQYGRKQRSAVNDQSENNDCTSKIAPH